VELYLIRHADAGERNKRLYPDDNLRPLSANGREAMKEIARGMKRCDIAFDAIFRSGLVRALQTAEIVAKAYRIPARRLKILSTLEPDRDPAEAVASLRKIGLGSVALVGHEPHLSTLVARLVAGKTPVRLELKKGGVCRVDLGRSQPAAER
jgi:phosphohistidine phosphatase